jgi:hypothetical protein
MSRCACVCVVCGCACVCVCVRVYMLAYDRVHMHNFGENSGNLTAHMNINLVSIFFCTSN